MLLKAQAWIQTLSHSSYSHWPESEPCCSDDDVLSGSSDVWFSHLLHMQAAPTFFWRAPIYWNERCYEPREGLSISWCQRENVSAASICNWARKGFGVSAPTLADKSPGLGHFWKQFGFWELWVSASSSMPNRGGKSSLCYKELSLIYLKKICLPIFSSSLAAVVTGCSKEMMFSLFLLSATEHGI